MSLGNQFKSAIETKTGTNKSPEKGRHGKGLLRHGNTQPTAGSPAGCLNSRRRPAHTKVSSRQALRKLSLGNGQVLCASFPRCVSKFPLRAGPASVQPLFASSKFLCAHLSGQVLDASFSAQALCASFSMQVCRRKFSMRALGASSECKLLAEGSLRNSRSCARSVSKILRALSILGEVAGRQHLGASLCRSALRTVLPSMEQTTGEAQAWDRSIPRAAAPPARQTFTPGPARMAAA